VGARGGTCYGAEKAALERFTQGLASEVYQHGISVTCVSPSQVVPTPGTVYHRLVKSIDDPRGEPPIVMARAALLLATEPLERVTGRVTYSQAILKEFGWIDTAKGTGTPGGRRGSGYSEVREPPLALVGSPARPTAQPLQELKCIVRAFPVHGSHWQGSRRALAPAPTSPSIDRLGPPASKRIGAADRGFRQLRWLPLRKFLAGP
jgi:hypothetical protein